MTRREALALLPFVPVGLIWPTGRWVLETSEVTWIGHQVRILSRARNTVTGEQIENTARAWIAEGATMTDVERGRATQMASWILADWLRAKNRIKARP